jgi:hypothetical protein
MIYFSIKQGGALHYFAAVEDALMAKVDAFILKRFPGAKRGEFFNSVPTNKVVHIIPAAESV